MKRIGNIYEEIISMDNLVLADYKARQGKKNQYGIQVHDKNWAGNIELLHEQLRTLTYKTSAYKTFPVFEPKERLVYQLPYFPDRITHHAIMNILEPIFVQNFTADTYSCIKGRGIHAASYALRKALRNEPDTRYCLKLDITKFYPSVNHDILKQLVRRKIKDTRLLWLLDEIIDSAPGLPIGNYLSQYMANFYLSYFDHWIKETMDVKDYFRYADDLVIPGANKPSLHALLADIRHYMHVNLKLQIKGNYQVFPVADRGIDFVGYVHYHTHTRLRKSIKQRFCRMIARTRNRQSIAAYNGWMVHCNSKHLTQKLIA